VVGISCSPYPTGAADPASLLSARIGAYSCLAANEFVRTKRGVVGRIGDPFWARIDFATARLAWCRITLLPGEMAAGSSFSVPLAQACDLSRPAPAGF
jgi:hypothetical protein